MGSPVQIALRLSFCLDVRPVALFILIKMAYSKMWKIVYTIYPPVLRLLEKVKFHKGRQPYLLGYLKSNCDLNELREFLTNEGFEDAILTWKDEGEVLNMRKVSDEVYQYHLRIFDDNEVRVHYEFSSEGSPLKHIRESCFEKRSEYFNFLLVNYLKK